jgi:hypothetical protein
MRIGSENKTGFIGLDNEGFLDIRVNSLQITGNVGNENLLRQTSPRKTVLVPHWIPVKTVTSSYETENGVTQTKTDTVYKESANPLVSNEIQEPVYIYDVSAWRKRRDQKDISTTKWSHSAAYATVGTVVTVTNSLDSDNPTDLGNIWSNNKAITANSNPPGHNSSWTPFMSVVTDEKDADDVKEYVLDINGDKPWITQSPELKKKKEYTISFYVRSMTATSSAKKVF